MHGPSRRLTDPHTWRIPRRQAPGGYGRTGQDAGRREADHDLTRLKLWTACFGLPFIWAGQKARCAHIITLPIQTVFCRSRYHIGRRPICFTKSAGALLCKAVYDLERKEMIKIL